MLKKVIKIDSDKCVGCGLCAKACQEGAIGMVDGKAKLMREDYCDGLGNCLPVCPTNAISFEEREITQHNQDTKSTDNGSISKKHEASVSEESVDEKPALACGCPGTMAKTFDRDAKKQQGESRPQTQSGNVQETNRQDQQISALDSQLRQWPCQIKLVPVKAPYFENANLLISADCAAYAYGDFHRKFMKNKITLIGCPKLDEGDYSEKLTTIIQNNDLKSITVVRMEVPCCGGIERAAKQAIQASGKMIPWRIVTIGTDGEILED
jgi:ferredoxin